MLIRQENVEPKAGGDTIQRNSGCIRREKYPRALILTPTRDLSVQVLKEIKSLTHHAKLSSCCVVGGGGKSGKQDIHINSDLEWDSSHSKRMAREVRMHAPSSSFALQKQNLSKKIDIVVATPARFLKHFLDVSN